MVMAFPMIKAFRATPPILFLQEVPHNIEFFKTTLPTKIHHSVPLALHLLLNHCPRFDPFSLR
jgi:hypothetical protein